MLSSMAQVPTGHRQMSFFPLKIRKTQLKKLLFSLWTNLGGKKKRKEQQGLKNVGWQHRLKLEPEDSFFFQKMQLRTFSKSLSTQPRCFFFSCFSLITPLSAGATSPWQALPKLTSMCSSLPFQMWLEKLKASWCYSQACRAASVRQHLCRE